MDRLMVLVLAALLCLAHSTPMQQPVVERSSRRPPPPQQRHQHQSEGNSEGEGQEYYNRGGSTEGTGDEEGARQRRLTGATATNLAANQQHQFAREPQGQQQPAKGAKTATTTTAGAGAAESRPAAAAAAAPAGRSDNTISRSVDGVQGSQAASKGAVGQEARVHVVQMDIVEGEGQAVESDGAVEVVEGGGAEEDKGIEEGEAGGFVVVARDGEMRPEEGETGDSVDNDNSSKNGISNNIMVIVFCALAFVANGGFLVYVFWVM